MKSYGGLFDLIIAPENLRVAMFRAAKGKIDRGPVQAFLEDADRELAVLHAALRDGVYRPRSYTQFRIMDPKPRTISCSDFRDRIAHHAICSVIGPLVERRFVADSFACRVGKGAHRAVHRAQVFSRRHHYFFKADIRKFYDSVDHGVLLALLDGMFRERRLRDLMAIIVRHAYPRQMPGIGLPIGNLTSQWFANLYLDAFDHFVKDRLGVKGYVRYMDDFVLWHDSKSELFRFWNESRDFLAGRLRLTLKAPACRVAPCSEGLPFLGLRVFPRMLRLQHGRYHRMQRLIRRREAQHRAGELSAEKLADCVRAAVGQVVFLKVKTNIIGGVNV
jgi:RNA-directed DNA polymerase